MAASIFTRATGVALYGGALIVTGWFAALMSGPDAYHCYMSILGSIPGKLALFGLTVSIFYHLAAGVRHLAFDVGAGFAPRTASLSAIACMAFAVVASLVVWFLALQTGGLR
jgi:succinate dehydrogenase / fumarate reductase cytochrome b subunit